MSAASGSQPSDLAMARNRCAFIEGRLELAAMESTDKPVPVPSPSDPGSIAGWAPPPWTRRSGCPAGRSPDAADRPFWRRIPADWLIAGALVLVSAVAGWYLYRSQSATGEPGREPTQVRTGSRRPTRSTSRTSTRMSSTSTTASTCASGTVSTSKLVRRDRARQGGPVHDRARVGALPRRGDGRAAARPRTRSRTTWSSTATPRSVTMSAGA